MRALGVNKNDHVIVYDDSLFMSSARAWWLFRLFGHENVSYLDGGLVAWQQAGSSKRLQQVGSSKQAHLQ